ncbi:MAG: hypothetical protein JF888_03290 [Candidatus Dormibacteraeota bacterium]|uniref:Uncharacterized protein n=1 Tax=Candidatus Dormiibacter inghamiae TaxID=3127013 RepID=A0A934KEK3_9BACT|nr:hypothetical protein [Candidatus Dormibacteraeota bacterium]MBJ7607116.1 hypothetical protein [Candidatus Dormibacteraeota bacterium]
MFNATLKSLLSRKLRLLLSGLAVVLGVMAVSGALVLTDSLGRSYLGFCVRSEHSELRAPASPPRPAE